jgi:hypothetical protein
VAFGGPAQVILDLTLENSVDRNVCFVLDVSTGTSINLIDTSQGFQAYPWCEIQVIAGNSPLVLGPQGFTGSPGPIGQTNEPGLAGLDYSIFGPTFNSQFYQLTNFPTTNLQAQQLSSSAMSYSGKYIYISNLAFNSGVWRNENYGEGAWELIETVGSIGFRNVDKHAIGVSSSGRYVTFASNRIYLSSDYGNTFTTATIAGTEIMRDFESCTTNFSGEIQIVFARIASAPSSGDNFVFITKDYGVSWGPVLDLSGNSFNSGYMSYSGQYAIAAIQQQSSSSGLGLFVSSDFCTTWEKLDQPNIYNFWTNSPTTTNINQYRCFVARMSDSGQFSCVVGGVSNALVDAVLLVSQSYGKNWFIGFSENAGQYAITSLTMTNTGQFQMAGTSTGYILYSNDYGSTWRKSDTNFNISINGNQYLSVSTSSYGDLSIMTRCTTGETSNNYGVYKAEILGYIGPEGPQGKDGRGVDASFLRGYTINSTLSSNTVVFNTISSTYGSNIQLSTTTGSIELAAGAIYKFQASVPSVVTNSTGEQFSFCWYDGTTPIGSLCVARASTSSVNNVAFGGVAEAIVDTTTQSKTVTFKLVGTNSSNIQSLIDTSIISSTVVNPWFFVELITGDSPALLGATGATGSTGATGATGSTPS